MVRVGPFSQSLLMIVIVGLSNLLLVPLDCPFRHDSFIHQDSPFVILIEKYSSFLSLSLQRAGMARLCCNDCGDHAS